VCGYVCLCVYVCGFGRVLCECVGVSVSVCVKAWDRFYGCGCVCSCRCGFVGVFFWCVGVFVYGFVEVGVGVCVCGWVFV